MSLDDGNNHNAQVKVKFSFNNLVNHICITNNNWLLTLIWRTCT